MAYIPARDGTAAATDFLQRPRFLALSEFGPRSLVYHEGRAYRVVRALLSLGGDDQVTPDAELPTEVVRDLCPACGAGHFDRARRRPATACGAPLGDAEIVNNVYRIENVATQPAERITANDEERQRQGFELQTTFQWAERGRQAADVSATASADGDGRGARARVRPGRDHHADQQGAAAAQGQEPARLHDRPGLRLLGRRTRTSGERRTRRPDRTPRQWIVP